MEMAIEAKTHESSVIVSGIAPRNDYGLNSKLEEVNNSRKQFAEITILDTSIKAT